MGRYVIGIDEVGRGSLAGPVVVAAVVAPANSKWLIANGPYELRDSKKLTPKRREEWFFYFKNHPHLSYAISRVYPRRIEKMNISKAANLAAFRAFCRLTTHYSLSTTNCRIYLDGGLYLGNKRRLTQTVHRTTQKKNLRRSAFSPRWSAVTVVRGDEKIKAIMIASIVAKVYRDSLMTRLGKIYPKYGFEVHKGYGTKTHFQSLKKHGASPVHRLTFLKKYHKIKS